MVSLVSYRFLILSFGICLYESWKLDTDKSKNFQLLRDSFYLLDPIDNSRSKRWKTVTCMPWNSQPVKDSTAGWQSACNSSRIPSISKWQWNWGNRILFRVDLWMKSRLMDVHSLGFNLQHRECGNVHKGQGIGKRSTDNAFSYRPSIGTLPSV
jgi:hypothetical protein